MVKTVAEQFAETFAATGVTRIYGIIGDSLNGLTDALRRQGRSNGSTGFKNPNFAAMAEAAGICRCLSCWRV